MPIPRFRGDVIEYRNFISIFDTTVHNDGTIGDAQKLAYLKGYLEGEAQKLLAGVIVTDKNYSLARNTLELYYGQSIQTGTVLYRRLEELPKAKNEPISIRDTFQAAESILQMLEQEGQKVNEDKHLYTVLLTKWPWQVIRHIMKHESVDMKEFREQMSKDITLQIKLMQQTGYAPPQPKPASGHRFFGGSTRGDTSGSSDQGASQQQTGSASTGEPGTKKKTNESTGTQQPPKEEKIPECMFCPGKHYAENCDVVTTAKARAAKIPNRCPRCFRNKHEGKCRHNRKCTHCPSFEHNRALCPIKYPDEPSKNFLTKSKNERADPAGKFITLLTDIRNPETKQTAQMRVLVDPAADRTCMTINAAQRIGITAKIKKRVTTGLGGREVEPISEDPAEVEICADENEPKKIFTRLTHKITDKVRVPDIAKFKQRYPQFAGHRIPPTGVGEPIDMILGSDKLVPFLRLDSGKFISEDLQLMASRFGWLIMGTWIMRRRMRLG